MSNSLIVNARPGRLIGAYRIVSRAYFHLPFVTIFLIIHGYQLLHIALLLALYSVVAALGDLLINPLKRRLSLTGSLALGEVIKVCGLLLIVFSDSSSAVAISQVLSGLGFSLTAGVDGALASTLRNKADAAKQEPRIQVGMFLISFTAALIGATAMLVWDRLPFLLSSFGSSMSLALVLGTRLPLVSRAPARSTPATVAAETVRAPAEVRFWALYYSLNRALLLSTYTLLIPVLLFTRYEISLVLFGALMGLYTLMGLVAARSSARLAGHRLLFALSSCGLILGIALLAVDGPTFAACSLALLGVAGGFVRPATMISLAPAMESMGDSARARLLRGLERNQGLLQAALLIVTGLSLALSSDVRLAIWITLVLCVALQLCAALFFERQRTLSS